MRFKAIIFEFDGVIADSVSGVAAAIAAGMSAVGLTAASHMGAGDIERLRAAGAHHIATDYESVAEWIELSI